MFAAACATSRSQSRPGGAPSSGVVTTGPSVSAKSRYFAPCSCGATHSTSGVKPPIAPSAPMIAATRSTGSAPGTRVLAVRLDRGRIGEAEVAGVVEDPHRRRMEHRRAEDDVGERVDRVLARSSAAGEERLQRLRRELDHRVAVDPSRPAALEILLHRT